MVVVNKNDFPRQFSSSQIKTLRDKEIKTWQWIVLFSCFFIQMFSYCVAQNLANVFVARDWSVWTNGNQTIMSLTFTVGAVGSAFFGPMIAKLFGKEINMRIIYSLGIFLAMLGFFGTGLSSLIPNNIRSVGFVAAILYISNLICQIGVMIFSGIGINNLISKWWPAEKRGFALGIAFAGGSAGNIWMQQLLNALAKKFGNVWVEQSAYNADPSRLITYGIFAGLGLIVGLFFVMIACRKPVPPNVFEEKQHSTRGILPIVCVNCNNNIKKNSINTNNNLDASFLVTRKYPAYWVLAIGYLILQIGTIHVSMSSQFIKNAAIMGLNPSSDDEINKLFGNISSLGLTVFGISCVIGNSLGGVLNQKMGPNKSIALAGTIQILSIVCLAFSVKSIGLIYLYFVLSGLSVYVYTSTPAFISGRLYGAKQSNSHVAILGIFVALGFAIANSVVGSVTGPVNKENQTNLLGVIVNGNMLGLILFSSICMGIGTIIVVTCATIIMRKGIKGLLEYSPTKYTRIVNFKYGFLIWLSSISILLTGRDFRVSNSKRAIKINNKIKKDVNYNTLSKFTKNLSSFQIEYKLSNNEFEVLSQIYLNQIITLNRLNSLMSGSAQIVDKLVDKGLIQEVKLNQDSKAYSISKNSLNKLSELNINNDITKENLNISKILEKIEVNTQNKLEKINKKLELVQNKEINLVKQEKISQKANKKLEKILIKKEEIFNLDDSSKYNEWQIYKKMYDVIFEEQKTESLKNKLESEKQQKIKQLQTKMFIANFIMNFDKNQEIEGHNLLIEFYNNQYVHYDSLINKKVAESIQRRIEKINNKVSKQQNKFNKLLNKQLNIFSSNPSYLESLEKQEFNPLEIIHHSNKHKDDEISNDLKTFDKIESINEIQEIK